LVAGPVGSPGTGLGALNLTDRRSYVYGLLVAAKLAAEPEAVLATAHENLLRLRSAHADGSADALLNRWGDLHAGPIEHVIAVLTSAAQASVALRHASPFAGALTSAGRTWVIRATRAAT
jgi:hypothetical protein